VHISENDRSTPGQGHIHWAETFDTLKATGYNGWFVVEAFGLALPELAAATKIWRRMFESEEQLSRDALAFMKPRVGQAGEVGSGGRERTVGHTIDSVAFVSGKELES